MSNGKKSELPYKRFKANEYSEVRIQPVGAVVKKVIMWGNSEFGGVQFFDKDGNKILEAGYIREQSREFVLGNGERLVGVKSKLYDTSPEH